MPVDRSTGSVVGSAASPAPVSSTAIVSIAPPALRVLPSAAPNLPAPVSTPGPVVGPTQAPSGDGLLGAVTPVATTTHVQSPQAPAPPGLVF